MDWQQNPIRHVTNPNDFNKQHMPGGQEVPTPRGLPGKELFLERPDFPARLLPAIEHYITEWIHTRQGTLLPRKDSIWRFLGRLAGQ